MRIKNAIADVEIGIANANPHEISAGT